MADDLKFRQLTDKHYAAIGKVVTQSAGLEILLEFYLAELLGLSDKKTQSLLKGAMLERKLSLVGELGLENLRQNGADEKIIAKFKKLIAEMSDQNANRVVAVHGMWLWENSNGSAPVAIKRNATSESRLSLWALKSMYSKMLRTHVEFACLATFHFEHPLPAGYEGALLSDKIPYLRTSARRKALGNLPKAPHPSLVPNKSGKT